MSLEWITDPRVFEARGDEWEGLRRADPHATVFHTPAFLKLYWEEFGHDRPLVGVVRDEVRPLGLCAFEIHDGTLAFLGGYEVTDYMGPVGRPPARERVAAELMAGLADRSDWERGDLEGLPEDSPWPAALARAAREAGLRVEVGEDDVAPMLDLPGAWETYLEGLKPKLRHEIRRKERRLREAFPDVRLVDSTPETASDDLERFVAMHRSSEGQKGRFMQPGVELFFRRLARALLPSGMLRLAFLQAEGAKLAGMVAFTFEGTLSLYNSAYDHAHAPVAPGMVLVSELIKDAILRGCDRVDMLKGNLGYKYRFGARPRPVRRLLLERP